MSGRDHETDINGECMPNCRECEMIELKASRWRMFEECLRRGIAIEAHREAMMEEKIQDYYFDRKLWSVLDGE